MCVRGVLAVLGLQLGSQIVSLWSIVTVEINLQGGEGLDNNLGGRNKFFSHAREKRGYVRGSWAVLGV